MIQAFGSYGFCVLNIFFLLFCFYYLLSELVFFISLAVIFHLTLSQGLD